MSGDEPWYERALREWLASRGMRQQRLELPLRGAPGRTVAYRLSPAAAPRGIVLVAHGAGNDSLFGFPALFKRLLEEGFEVCTLDLPGHGRNSTTRLTTEAAAKILPEALAWAVADRPGLSAHLIGLSFGGSLGLAALPEMADELASATLVSAPLNVQFSARAVLNELRPRLLLTALGQREHAGLTGLIPSFGPFKRGLYPLRLGVAPAGSFGYVTAVNHMLGELQLEQAARAASTPVLLVYGGRDRLVPVAQGEALAGLIPGAELLRIPGGTHLTTFFARQTTAKIVSLLTGVPETTPAREEGS